MSETNETTTEEVDDTGEDSKFESRSSFLETLPEDLRENQNFRDINSTQDLARSFVHAQGMVGKDKVAIPGENATPEERSSFYSALGRPENSSGYGLDKPEDWPEQMPYDSDVMSEFGDKSHELGLSSSQVKGLAEWYLKGQVTEFGRLGESVDKAKEEVDKLLTDKFGAAKQERIESAKLVLREYGNEDTVAYLEETGLGNHPGLVEMLSNIGVAIQADKILVGEGKSNFAMTPEEAKQEIATLQADDKFMEQYNTAFLEGHEAAVDKMSRLFEFAHPSDEPVAIVGTRDPSQASVG